MAKTLFVCKTYEHAKHKFNEFVSACHPNDINKVSNLCIEVDSNIYEFISASDSLHHKIMGKTFSNIIIDELVTLTPEENSLLLSRKRD